ncbi:MAG: DNA-binding protein [Ammonifex sp.]|jgi:excisionase family DNA binding protein|nr:MAG: DNA-binding protein [Ammonifex sp.]
MERCDWNDLPAILTVEETARFLRRGYRCVLCLCHSKNFPAVRLGRTWRINRDGLRRWLEEQAGNGGR